MAKGPSISRRLSRISWLCTGFLVAGFVPAYYFAKPVVAMALAAACTIPLGSRAPGVKRGGLRGLFYGTIAGAGMWLAIANREIQHVRAAAGSQPASSATTAPTTQPAVSALASWQGALIIILWTAILCAAVGALFAYMAQRRRQRIEQEWR